MIEDALYWFTAPLLSLMLLSVLFSPLEKCFPAKRQNFFRPEWLTDLCFFLGQLIHPLLPSGLRPKRMFPCGNRPQTPVRAIDP